MSCLVLTFRRQSKPEVAIWKLEATIEILKRSLVFQGMMVELQQKRDNPGIEHWRCSHERGGCKRWTRERLSKGAVQEMRKQDDALPREVGACANARSGSIKSCRKAEHARNQKTFRVGNLEVAGEFKRATYMTPQTRNGFVTD